MEQREPRSVGELKVLRCNLSKTTMTFSMLVEYLSSTGTLGDDEMKSAMIAAPKYYAQRMAAEGFKGVGMPRVKIEKAGKPNSVYIEIEGEVRVAGRKH